MEISVQFDEHGFLPDAYGKYCAGHDKKDGMCLRSFPFTVAGLPAETKALAWIFLDWDSTPVCGFPWIHWCAYQQLASDEAQGGATSRTDVTVADNCSRIGAPDMYQGYNSAAKRNPTYGTGYVGPCPPDKDHVYTLRIAALDAVPDLHTPFWANELVAACRSHVLTEAVVQLPSRS